MRYKDAKASLPQIARELGVDAVVEGSVLRAGGRVRINARVSHAPSDRSLWSESYERDLADVLVLQRELAEAITRKIQVVLTADERTRMAAAPAVDPDVYQAYLKGRHHLKGTEQELRTAMEYFQDTVRRDPRYAPGHAGLAMCYALLGTVAVGRSPADTRPLAVAAAQRALELDDGLAEAHAALAEVKLFDWDWTAAEEGFRRAIQLNPSLAQARVGFSQYLLGKGRLEEALAEARRAEEIDPLWPRTGHQVGYVLLMSRRYDESIDQYHRVLALDPTFVTARWFLGMDYAQKSMFDEAIAQLERGVTDSGRSPAILGSLGLVQARAGRKEATRAILAELEAQSRRRYVSPAAFVFVSIALGDTDGAFAWLEKAAQDRTNLMIFLGVYPPLDPLRSDPRFKELLRRVGLPA
jgi:tetratricopeptide (TPR) repeat protein